jgi:hypothetical protein
MATLQESLIDTLTAGKGNSAVATNTAFGLNALKLKFTTMASRPKNLSNKDNSK